LKLNVNVCILPKAANYARINYNSWSTVVDRINQHR